MIVCPPHAWGATERSDRSIGRGEQIWHWCRCVRCGAPGFRVDDSQVVRTWERADAVKID
jgi:hypothetical protein